LRIIKQQKILFDIIRYIFKLAVVRIQKASDNMKILITGAHGFVGNRLMQDLHDAAAAPSMRGMNEEQIRKIVEESKAEIIIHTAAISDVGTCEKNPEASYEANVRLPWFLAKAAKEQKLICFSSDQVYRGCAGEGPYKEEDAAPCNVYGSHKLEMEQRVLDVQPDAVMLRAEWMYDYPAERSNYLRMLLNEKQVLTFGKQYRGITYLREVAENMPKIFRLPGGVYNFGSETKQTMYDITCEMLRFLKSDRKPEEVPPAHNLWMDCAKAKEQGILFSDVVNGLKRCLKDYHLAKE